MRLEPVRPAVRPNAEGALRAEYFAPLKAWLDEQNRGKKIGW